MNTASFILQHLETADVHRLLLSAQRYPDVDVPYAVAQIEALRKVKDKIPLWYNTELRFPPGLSVEQSSSERTARFKAGLFAGAAAADLTGGMGIDSYFWAHSFQYLDYVEQSAELCALARHNFSVLGANNIAVHHTDAADFVARATRRYDLVYLDPARRDQHKNRVFLLTDCTPDIVAMQEPLWAITDNILVKTSPMMDIALALKQLRGVTKVWVVSVHNECKEVLYRLERNAAPETNPEIICVELGKTDKVFQTTFAHEQTSHTPQSVPLQYLYEPHASVMKAGVFHSFGVHYGLLKLDTHTHIYTSEQPVPDVPARSFRVVATVKYDAKAVQPFVPEGKANIATRNFPDSVETMRKKLKLKDGGDVYLFGVTVAGMGKAVVVCERIEVI